MASDKLPVASSDVPQKLIVESRVALWRSRNFMFLWSGQTVAELGTRISSIAVPLLAATYFGASVFEISLLTALAWMPYLIFSLPAGVVADRVDQRRLMIFCDLGRVVLMASIPVTAFLDGLTLGYLYVVVSLAGMLKVFFNVAYPIPRCVREVRLRREQRPVQSGPAGRDPAALVSRFARPRSAQAQGVGQVADDAQQASRAAVPRLPGPIREYRDRGGGDGAGPTPTDSRTEAGPSIRCHRRESRLPPLARGTQCSVIPVP